LDRSYQPYAGGYHHREGYSAAGAGRNSSEERMYTPKTFWTWAFVVIAVVQAAIVLAFEA
jgi:hypothetical protein